MKNVKKSRSNLKRQSSKMNSKRINNGQCKQQWRMAPIAAAVMCACSSGIVAPTTHAQDSDGLLEEIIVTAQRRDQKIQDIPYNISAYTSEDLDAARAFGLGDISRLNS